MGKQIFRQLSLALVLGALAIPLVSCGSSVSIPGVGNFTISKDDDGDGAGSNNGTANITVDPVNASAFVLSSTYTRSSGGYLTTTIKHEANRVAISSRKLPLTFLPADSNTAKVTVLSDGNESKFLKASIVNRKVEFEFIPGSPPENNLTVKIESVDQVDFAPINVADYRNWTKVSYLNLVNSKGEGVGSRTENTAKFTTVHQAGGEDLDLVPPDGRFKIDFGSKGTPSNPDLYIDNSKPDYYETRLVEDNGTLYLDVLPKVTDAAAIIRVTSVEDASFTSVIKVSPPSLAIRGDDKIIYDPVEAAGKTKTFRFSTSRFTKGTVLKLFTEDGGGSSKIFATSGDPAIISSDNQVEIPLSATLLDTLTEGDEEIIRVAAFSDIGLTDALKDSDGEIVDFSFKVIIRSRPVITGVDAVELRSNEGNTTQTYSFDVTNFPAGSVVQLTTAANNSKVFATAGNAAEALSRNGSVKFEATTLQALNVGDSETLIATAYTDNTLGSVLRDIGNNTVSTSMKVNVVLPPGEIYSITDQVIADTLAGTVQSYTFNLRYLPAGSVVAFTQGDSPKVFDALSDNVVTVSGQTEATVNATTKGVLNDKDTETITATVYADDTLTEILKDEQGNDLIATVNVRIRADYVILDHNDVVFPHNERGATKQISFSVANLPIGSMVELKRGTGGNEVFETIGTGEIIVSKDITSVTFDVTVKADITSNQEESLTAVVYTDSLRSEILQNSLKQDLVASLHAKVVFEPTIYDAPDTRLSYKYWKGKPRTYTFPIIYLPAGTVVNLERSSKSSNREVIDTLGSPQTITEGQTEVTFDALLQNVLVADDNETLVAKAYTDASMTTQLENAVGEKVEGFALTEVIPTPTIAIRPINISKFKGSVATATLFRYNYVPNEYDTILEVHSATGSGKGRISDITATFVGGSEGNIGDYANKIRVEVVKPNGTLVPGDRYSVNVYILREGTTDKTDTNIVYRTRLSINVR